MPSGAGSRRAGAAARAPTGLPSAAGPLAGWKRAPVRGPAPRRRGELAAPLLFRGAAGSFL